MPAARGSCCSAGHTCHTLTLPCQDPLARAKRARFGNSTAPSAHCLFLPAGRGSSEGALGSTAQLTSEESLQQLPWCHLIRGEGQQPTETRTPCSHGPDPSPCVWEHPRDLSPESSSTAHTSSGTHCNRQSKNFQLFRNGALWSLLLKALYNPSVKCAMKCKVLLLSQTKILFLFLKYLGISQHFPNKSVFYKNKYWEDKRDSSPTILVKKFHFSMLKSLLSFQKISKHLR